MSHLLPHGARTVTTVTAAAYTVAATDELVLLDATSNGIVVTLPAASQGARHLQFLRIDNTLANAVTIQRAGSDLFGTSLETVVPLLLFQRLNTVSDGTSRWHYEIS